MALRVLDGNQTATTLSSVVTGGEHIVAHSVVSLGTNAIANITSAVSGSVVSISNFPSTQPVSIASVTIGNSITIGSFSTSVTARLINPAGTAVTYAEIGTAGNPSIDVLSIQGVTSGTPLQIFGSVTLGAGTSQIGTVTVGNSVTIGSLPAISGTVTARLQDGSGNNLTSTSIGGVQRLNVSLASAATAGGTLPSFINIHGGTDGSVARTMLLDSSGRTVVTVSNFPTTQPVSLASTTVTVSSLPNVTIGNSVTIASIPAISGTVTANSSNGSLTTRFGTPTTANVSFATSAVTNANRKYLLIQNVTTGSNVITVGIGFTPTTTQGIQLTAGAGITFESSYIPTGAVWVLSSVTASNFTILEA